MGPKLSAAGGNFWPVKNIDKARDFSASRRRIIEADKPKFEWPRFGLSGLFSPKFEGSAASDDLKIEPVKIPKISATESPD